MSNARKPAVAKRTRAKAKAKTPLKLNLACGQARYEDYRGVDLVAGEAVDEVADLLSFPWPWEDSSVAAVYCSHFVEHIGYDEGKDLVVFMNELYRVLEPGGEARIMHPYCWSNRAWQDPTHKRAIVAETWSYFAADWRKANGLDHYPITCDFDVALVTGIFAPPWDRKSDEARQQALSMNLNVLADLVVDLKARK